MARNNRPNGSFNYNNIEKKDKNFMYMDLKRSKSYNVNFAGSKFDFVSFRGAHFKSCSFLECSFKGAEFIGSNLRGCKFKNASFENTIFEGAKLDGVDFKDATFKNVILVDTNLDEARNLDLNNEEIRIFEKMPVIEVSDALKEATEKAMENSFIKVSRVFDTKEGKLNHLTLMVLLESFSEDELINGLEMIKDSIDKDFHTLSYIIRYIKINL
ncbi:MAG: pentapeptide repeat-containing protein [Clostridium sp.]